MGVLNGAVPEIGLPSASSAVKMSEVLPAKPLASGVPTVSGTLAATGSSVAFTLATPLTAGGTGTVTVESRLPPELGWSKNSMMKLVALDCATTEMSHSVTALTTAHSGGGGERFNCAPTAVAVPYATSTSSDCDDGEM